MEQEMVNILIKNDNDMPKCTKNDLTVLCEVDYSREVISQIVIQDNVPVAPQRRYRKSWRTELLNKMAIDQSIFAPLPVENTKVHRARWAGNIATTKRLTGKKFVQRLVTEHNVLGLRIWRTQ